MLPLNISRLYVEHLSKLPTAHSCSSQGSNICLVNHVHEAMFCSQLITTMYSFHFGKRPLRFSTITVDTSALGSFATCTMDLMLGYPKQHPLWSSQGYKLFPESGGQRTKGHVFYIFWSVTLASLHALRGIHCKMTLEMIDV